MAINKLTSVSVGIPAYNEESNIIFLINSILNQKLSGIILNEIIIVCDGCTDKTVSLVKSLKNNKIKLIVNSERQGKVSSMNKMIKIANGDILIVLDADILPADNNFLVNISLPIVADNNIGVVGAETVSVKPTTFFEKVISDSHKFKTIIYKKIDGGNNIFLCHGRGLAFNKDFYKKLHLINNHPTDAQSYLFCLSDGFKFKFQEKAKVLFSSPKTFNDHKRQHDRFVSGKKSFSGIFPYDFVSKAYYIPNKLLTYFLFNYFISDPISFICYFTITFYLMIFKSTKDIYMTRWEMSKSTKKVIL